MSYTHFTLNERNCLQKLLAKGLSMRKIAAALDRSPSSISREINRNKAKYRPHKKSDNSYWYNAWRAQNQYIRRRRRQECRAIRAGTDEWTYVIDKLNKYWSPEQICGRWSHDFADKKSLCCSTIYRYIKKKQFPNIKAKSHLRRRGKRAYARNTNYNSIQPERIIPEWLDVIKQRKRIGDWEGDTVYGAVGKGFLVTLVDRRSRFLCAGLLKSRMANATKDVIEKLLYGKPIKSISLDNGSEFADFRALEEELNTEVYFAEPHKPWQRGTNENTNDILRFFFPKGFNFHELSSEKLDEIVLSINLRPRKCLNWKCPFEVFYGVALA